MTIAAAILLIVIGAILTFATNIHVQGFSLHVVGWILMIGGAVGLILSFFQEAIWAGRTRRRELGPGEERREPPPPPRY
ncbi:MAG TPA: DUF6458 family protein [Solirubrobacterales bacterium]|nr:DUF6458 family protein [Solirubrobacterales bacterium]